MSLLPQVGDILLSNNPEITIPDGEEERVEFHSLICDGTLIPLGQHPIMEKQLPIITTQAELTGVISATGPTCVSDNGLIIYTRNATTVDKSVDGGLTFTTLPHTFGTEGNGACISADGLTYFTSDVSGNVKYTLDGGINFLDLTIIGSPACMTCSSTGETLIYSDTTLNKTYLSRDLLPSVEMQFQAGVTSGTYLASDFFGQYFYMANGSNLYRCSRNGIIVFQSIVAGFSAIYGLGYWRGNGQLAVMTDTQVRVTQDGFTSTTDFDYTNVGVTSVSLGASMIVTTDRLFTVDRMIKLPNLSSPTPDMPYRIIADISHITSE